MRATIHLPTAAEAEAEAEAADTPSAVASVADPAGDSLDSEALFKEAKRRARRRRLLVASAALTLAAGTGAVAASLGGGPPRTQANVAFADKVPPIVTRFSTEYPVGYPANFRPGGVDTLSAKVFFVYGRRGALGTPPTVILRTTDGGKRFERIPAPPEPSGPGAYQAAISVAPESTESAVQFANLSDGYALESVGMVPIPSSLYATRDGGALWARVPWSTNVVQLAVTRRGAFALLADCSRFSPCRNWRLATQVPGAATWLVTPLHASLAPGDSISMTASGTGGWIYHSGPTKYGLEITRFSASGALSHAHHASGLVQPCRLAASSSRVIWATCNDTPNGNLARGVLWRSSDGGTHFARVRTLTSGLAIVVPKSSTEAFVRNGASPTFTVVSRGGRTIRVIVRLARAPSMTTPLSFSSITAMNAMDDLGLVVLFHTGDTHGAAGSRSSVLFVTRDGGRRWVRLR